MKPPRFSYLRPTTLSEAADALADAGEGAKILAGGQSLIPLLNYRLARPEVLVDLNFVSELARISESDGDLLIGAMVRQRDAELSPLVESVCPMLTSALSQVGHLQIRNRGTIGGSLAHADPAAELPAVAMCLDAQIRALGPDGARVIEAQDFFTGPFTTALRPNEILTDVRIPAAPDQRSAFIEFARRGGDFALAGVAASIETHGSNVATARLAALGVGATPIRLAATEEFVTGLPLDEQTAERAATPAMEEVDPLGDIHADADYRRKLLGTLVTRSLLEVAA